MSPSANHPDAPKSPADQPSDDQLAPLGPPGWDEFAAARDRFLADRAQDAVLARLERAWAESDPEPIGDG